VRGHHQKTHVIDDILRREQRAVFMGGVAQLRNRSSPPWRGGSESAPRNRRRCVHGRGRRAPSWCRVGLADHRDRAATMSTKARVSRRPRGLGRRRGTRSRRGRGELLHRRVEQHRPRLRLPLPDPRRDPAIERREVGFHRAGLKATDSARRCSRCSRNRAASVRAETASPESGPSRGSRRTACLVEQHQLVASGPSSVSCLAEDVAAIDQPVFAALRSTCPLGSASTSSVLPMIGHPRRREYDAANALCG